MRLIGNPNQLPSGGTPEPGQFTKPRYCAVIPNRTTDPEGFIDTGNTHPITGESVLVSIAAAKELGRFVGMVTGKELDALREDFEEQLDAQASEIHDLAEKVEAAQDLEKARTLVAVADADPDPVAA